MFSCLLCHEQASQTVADQVRDSVEHSVVACYTCGHVQLYPVPTDAELDAYYRAETQRKTVHGHLTREQKRLHVKADTDRRVALVGQIFEYNSNQICGLDVGCGEGFFGEAINRLPYCYVSGAEINDFKAVVVDAQYDFVSAFHVAEHVPNSSLFVIGLWRFVKLGGCLIIEVPNHDDWLIARCPAYAAWHYQRAHLHYFTPRTLLSALTKSGIEYRGLKLFGVQRYGLASAYHWLWKEEPQIDMPIGERRDEPIEHDYRQLRESTLTSDALCVVIQK